MTDCGFGIRHRLIPLTDFVDAFHDRNGSQDESVTPEVDIPRPYWPPPLTDTSIKTLRPVGNASRPPIESVFETFTHETYLERFVFR